MSIKAKRMDGVDTVKKAPLGATPISKAFPAPKETFGKKDYDNGTKPKAEPKPKAKPRKR